MSISAIECSNVTFSYLESGREILKDAALRIPQGGITVLMGSSGCGKSTLAALLCGLLPENGGFLKSGDIKLYGRNIKDFSVSERAGYISMMFQNPDLQFCMPTLREELIFCAENISIDPKSMPEMVEKAADKLGTKELLDRPLHTLSGGEKQRAVLTCIILLNAKCIILDEAFANLDPDAVKELMPLFTSLCRDDGKTILAIDHMSDHWHGIADRFILLGKEGQILCEAESDEQLSEAKDIFIQEGIAYPGIWKKKERNQMESAENCNQGILLDNITIFDCNPKKTLFGGKTSVPANAKELYINASAVVNKGKITALMGRSGCGKTTLMMTLLKQHEYKGTILLSNETKKELSSISNKECFEEIGIAFQNPSNQFVTQNVLEEVLDALKRKNKSESEDKLKEKALTLLESCGLRKFQKYSPYMLSQGQQRRLAVLTVLASGSRYLLLDEPTYGQDYRSACALMDLVSEMVRNEGLTVLMSTHDKGLADAYADVTFHVKDRKIVKEDDVNEI